LYAGKGILGDLAHYPSIGNQYKFAANILAIPVVGMIMGLITGILAGDRSFQ